MQVYFRTIEGQEMSAKFRTLKERALGAAPAPATPVPTVADPGAARA